MVFIILVAKRLNVSYKIVGKHLQIFSYLRPSFNDRNMKA